GGAHPGISAVAVRQARQGLACLRVVPIPEKESDTKSNAWLGIIGQSYHAGCYLGGSAQERLHGLDHALAPLGIIVAQSGEGRWFVEAVEIGQRPDGLNARLGPRGILRQLTERCDCGWIATMQQQPLYSVALPAAGAVEGSDQAWRIEIAQAWNLAGF